MKILARRTSNEFITLMFFLRHLPGFLHARGLRTILENVLLDTMYNLPSLPDVSKVVIDEAVISGETEPYLIYDQNSAEKKAAKD